MMCPKCGARLGVYKSERENEKIFRTRKCPACGRKSITVEIDQKVYYRLQVLAYGERK